jgi:hypothetical protein
MSDSVSLPSAAPPPRPRRRWLRWLLWAIVFGSGFVAGAGLTLIGVRKGLLESIHHPETMPKKVAERLRKPLQLSPEQMRRIEQIVAERQQVLLQIRVRVQPEVEAELDVIQREIAKVLDEKQRVKWEQLFDQLRRTWLPPMPQAETPPSESPHATPLPDDGQGKTSEGRGKLGAGLPIPPKPPTAGLSGS